MEIVCTILASFSRKLLQSKKLFLEKLVKIELECCQWSFPFLAEKYNFCETIITMPNK